jgi:hypothetical protein
MRIELIYLRYCIAAFLTLILWGLLAPILISSPTDIGVILGIIVALFVPVMDYWIIRPIYKKKPEAEQPAQNYKVKK